MKSRRSSQGLLLFSLLLLAFSIIPAEPIIRGDERITADGGRKSKIMVKDAVVILDDDVFNGCTPHNASASNFCCDKDNLCWPSLTECVINCPCKVRCNR